MPRTKTTKNPAPVKDSVPEPARMSRKRARKDLETETDAPESVALAPSATPQKSTPKRPRTRLPSVEPVPTPPPRSKRNNDPTGKRAAATKHAENAATRAKKLTAKEQKAAAAKKNAAKTEKARATLARMEFDEAKELEEERRGRVRRLEKDYAHDRFGQSLTVSEMMTRAESKSGSSTADREPSEEPVKPQRA